MEHELELKEMRAYDQKDAKVFYIRDPFPGIKEAYYVNLKVSNKIITVAQFTEHIIMFYHSLSDLR